MFRQRVIFDGRAPSFECVASNFVARLDAVRCKSLIAGARQDPAGVLGENQPGDAAVVGEILFDRSQPLNSSQLISDSTLCFVTALTDCSPRKAKTAKLFRSLVPRTLFASPARNLLQRNYQRKSRDGNN